MGLREELHRADRHALLDSVVLKTERIAYVRYLHCSFPSTYVTTDSFGTAGRVYFCPIDVPWPVIVDRIVYQVAATSAGNIRVGIYREGATADSPAGADLVVESASTPQAAANNVETVTIADTELVTGQYFLAIQGSATTATFRDFMSAGGFQGQYYDRAGGYGPFTDPCPSLTVEDSIPYMCLRVKKNCPTGVEW